jgi:hypothetical protein
MGNGMGIRRSWKGRKTNGTIKSKEEWTKEVQKVGSDSFMHRLPIFPGTESPV